MFKMTGYHAIPVLFLNCVMSVLPTIARLYVQGTLYRGDKHPLYTNPGLRLGVGSVCRGGGGGVGGGGWGRF